MTILEIRPPEELPKLLRVVAGLPDGRNKNGLWRHRKKDGSILDVEITSYSFAFDGRPADFVIAADVSERQRTKKERRIFTASLEAANRELDLRNREVERARTLAGTDLATFRERHNAIISLETRVVDVNRRLHSLTPDHP